MTYPKTPGHQGIDTSIAASLDFAPYQQSQQMRVFTAIKAAGAHGATADEVADSLGWSPYRVRPRTSELRRNGAIIDSGMRRLGHTGRRVIVWNATKQGGEK